MSAAPHPAVLEPSLALLIQMARNGSGDDVGRLIEACRPYLLHIANEGLLGSLRAEAAVSDLVQETCLDAIQGFGRFVGDTTEQWRAWLREILLNNLFDLNRQFATAGRDVTRESPNDADEGDSPLWQLPGHRLPPALVHPTPRVWAVAVAGDTAITGSQDGTARIWDHPSGRLRHVLRGHTAAIRCVAIHPECRIVATGGLDGTVRLWDAVTERPARDPLRHPSWVSSAVFSPDGGALFTGSLDGVVRGWDVTTGRPIGPEFRP